MKYITGTIADVIYNDTSAILILDAGGQKHHLRATDSKLLAEALNALFGDDCVGKSAALQCNGEVMTSIEIPGIAPNYTI